MATTANALPAILIPTNGWSSISVYRALKQVKELLEEIETTDDLAQNDKVQASIDDVDVMMFYVDRG